MEHINLDRINGERHQKFYAVYDEQHIAITDLHEKVILKDSILECRFCKKKEPEVSFRKDAHLIPQAIGNRYLITSFECDICNSFFGETYENSFSNFLSISKVFAKVKNRNNRGKHSKHKEPNRGLEVEAGTTAYKITFSHLDESAFSIDKDQKQATLKTVIPSYIPLYVYKTLVKIGMCLIAASEVDNFSKCFRFLLVVHKIQK